MIFQAGTWSLVLNQCLNPLYDNGWVLFYKQMSMETTLEVLLFLFYVYIIMKWKKKRSRDQNSKELKCHFALPLQAVCVGASPCPALTPSVWISTLRVSLDVDVSLHWAHCRTEAQMPEREKEKPWQIANISSVNEYSSLIRNVCKNWVIGSFENVTVFNFFC